MYLNFDLPQDTNVNKIIFDIVFEAAASFEDRSLKWLLSERKLFNLLCGMNVKYSYGVWSTKKLIYVNSQALGLDTLVRKFTINMEKTDFVLLKTSILFYIQAFSYIFTFGKLCRQIHLGLQIIWLYSNSPPFNPNVHVKMNFK